MFKAYYILRDKGKDEFWKYINRLNPPMPQNDVNAILLKHKIVTDKETREKVEKMAKKLERRLLKIGEIKEEIKDEFNEKEIPF